jgi:hypothetical protein
MDELLTIEAVAELVQVEPETVEAWMRRGLGHQRQPDGAIAIRRADLDSFLASEGQGRARDAASET